jgi:hypothetical protein
MIISLTVSGKFRAVKRRVRPVWLYPAWHGADAKSLFMG